MAAYEVQDNLVASAGLSVAGFKIGATNTQIQSQFGVDEPFSGRIFKDFVSMSPARVPAHHVNFYAIEPEFGFLMGRSLAPDQAPFSREDLAEAIVSVHPVIEVPDSRYSDWLSMKVEDLIADNAIGCLLCLGSPAVDGLSRNLSRQEVVVRVNEEITSKGTGSNVLGDPWNALVWVANHLSERGITLEAGQVVSTGSTTAIVQCKPGDRVTADFGPIGAAEVCFEASTRE